MLLATKIAVRRRQRKAREVLRRLRLAYYEFEGTDRFLKYLKLVARLERKVKT